MGFLYFLAALLALFFVWGLFWPRSQWRVLASWSRRDPDATEPGPVAYAFHRTIAAVGIGVFGFVGIGLLSDYLASRPEPEPAPGALEVMWGPKPEPKVVDRVVIPAGAPDPALVPAPIAGAQIVDNVSHTPRYLAFLEVFEPPGANTAFIGIEPSTGFAALDSAEMVVGFRVKQQCVPQQAVVIETETTVQIGVYVGLAAVGSASGDNSFCAGGSLFGPSVLLPINLSAPVGEREIQDLEGNPLHIVEPLEVD